MNKVLSHFKFAEHNCHVQNVTLRSVPVRKCYENARFLHFCLQRIYTVMSRKHTLSQPQGGKTLFAKRYRALQNTSSVLSHNKSYMNEVLGE